MPLHEWFIHLNRGCTKGVQAFEQKSVAIFFCFHWLIQGRSVYHLFRRKLHNCFHPPLGQSLSWTAECCALQNRQAGGGGTSCVCCAEGCSGTLCHECSTLTFLVNPWLIRSPACSLPRNSGAALEAFIKLLFCTRLSELLWMEICSSLCLHLSCLWGMSTNWSFLWQLQTRRKPRRAQQSFIH